MHSHNDGVTILMADDDADDRFLTREAFEEIQIPNHFKSFDDGVELMDYLHQRHKYAPPESSPRPGLVLLDLNMPK
ncbi:MAG TPA: response regulator, partial [Pirellulaceae bacterium]|nr:response regulator [Pirellulaceae bacterium]